MAFHVACPITCRRICDCELGYPRRGGREREGDIALLEEFLRDPWFIRVEDGGGDATVNVSVPKVVPMPAPAAEYWEETALSQVKRTPMQQKAAVEPSKAEDYARRLEVQGEADGEGPGSSIVEVVCHMCFSRESEGNDQAVKMLSCKFCNKKYHKRCLKNWAKYRDLFHWGSWACPSCRICEVCRRAGDPTKLMFCKRCDAAYHCYCQQPAHKNVSHGPYLCPKHTRCHSCGSTVSGSGLSTKWFLGYTFCDACGRLFGKKNYCPVCLKVYRDSEVTPMVCCDVCGQWVHCQCDDISDEKYQQFQADQNLYYKCPACRGDCYQVKGTDDAVQELWRRRDEADRDLIANLREAAGLPSQDIYSVSPYSDDEQNSMFMLKNDHRRSLKLTLKGLSDKSAKDIEESQFVLNKKHMKKGYQTEFLHKSEESYQNFGRQHEARFFESTFRDQKIGGIGSCKADGPELLLSSMRSTSNDEVNLGARQLGGDNHSFVKEVAADNEYWASKFQSKASKVQGVHVKESAGKNESKSESVKGTKLVIHCGTKNRNTSSSSRSGTSSCQRKRDIAASYGGEDAIQPKTEDRGNNVLEAQEATQPEDGKGDRFDGAKKSKSTKQGNREKATRKLSEINIKANGNILKEYELVVMRGSPPIKGKRSTGVGRAAGAVAEATITNSESLPKIQHLGTLPSGSHETSQMKFTSHVSTDHKLPLKLKIKNPFFEQQSSWASRGEAENYAKGLRTKRKRPTEKVDVQEKDRYAQLHHENPVEMMDAKILQKLGKDAVGKRVEVHLLSENSWHQGVVSSIIEGTSSLAIRLDDGKTTTVELGKQGVRFVAQKPRTMTS